MGPSAVVALIVALVLLIPGHAAAEGRSPVFSALAESLLVRAGSAERAERERARAFQHQVRSHDAMCELVEALPREERPRRILYLAAGAHLATLALCEALPEGAPCELLLTEVDPTVQGSIGDLLGELVRLELATALEAGEPLSAAGGTRTWRLRLGSHLTTITLRVAARSRGGPPPLVRTSDLAGADLVISHDWSGDPLANLRVIYDLLLAARAADGRAPLLMIEDLERHPYPVDLSFFSPRARTRRAYGHRTSDAGIGRHGRVELGEPLFGGGVLLGFDSPWWRDVAPGVLEGFFNFLLFNQFDDQRQNVLEGGERPLLAPAVLDWWTGFGRRTIRNQNLAEEPGARIRMLDAAVAVAARLEPPLRQRLACRLGLYRSLLHLRAAEADLAPLLPAATWCRTLEPKDFPSEEMLGLYDEALTNEAVRTADLEAERAEAAKRLERLESAELFKLARECPLKSPETGKAATEAWAASARAASVWLADHVPSTR